MQKYFKHNCIIVFFYLITFPLLAQESPDFPTLEFGAVFKNDTREIPLEILGNDEDGFYVLYSRGRFGQGKQSIRKFNLNLTPTGQEIDLNETEEKRRTVGIAQFEDKIVHVWTELSDTGKSYYYQNVDLEAFSLGEKRFLTEIKNDSKSARYTGASFFPDPETNTFQLFYTIPNKNKEMQRVKLQHFDTDFNLINENEFELPYTNKQFTLYKVLKGNDDEILVLGKNYFGSNIVALEGKKQYEHILYRIKDGTLEKLATIPADGKHLRYLSCVMKDDGHLLLSSLYSDKNMYGLKGIFQTKINVQDGTVLYSQFNPLDADFFTKLMPEGKRQKKVMKKVQENTFEAPYYILNKSMELASGGSLFLAEQIHSQTIYNSTTYYHENLAVFQLDESGKMQWSNAIGKKQQKRNVAIYSSYLTIPKDDATFLIYNGNLENLNHSNGSVINAFTQGSALIAAKIHADGHYERKMLTDKTEMEGITIRPGLSNWIDENTLLLFGQDIDNLKNQRFVKVKFTP
ncbi:hypothetical protein [Spongiimicrobium salis]|uniref:hypothetical protein n=1 Tax=Spongiimicrobium salis TaxID=1667022 RepID=UPI00374CBDD7